MKKTILWLIIIGLVTIGAIFGYQRFGVKKELPYELANVTRGDITEEVFETGTVKASEEIDLGFKNAGRIEKIWVEKGEKVKEGDVLAKLENSQLKIQLKEARANLEVAQAKLNKLLAGASPEEIQIAKTAVENANTSLATAKQSLEDIKSDAADDLDSAYQDALNTLDDAYLKIYNTYNSVDSIQRTYFTANDQEGIKVRENKDVILKAMADAKSYLDTAKADSKNENIDTALSEMKKSLESVSDALKIIRQTCEEPTYRNLVSSTDKTSLDTHRGYINTALTNVVNSQQIISSTKLTNEYNINTAQAKVSTAEGQLKAAEDELARITAPPRQEDIDLYEAQINQAQAQDQLLESQIRDTILKSPISGVVIKINKKVGETVQITDSAISLISSDDFQIEVNIYEEDIVKIKINDPVDIILTAFPEKVFKGKVISVDPAEKLIEGVVYYEVNIAFDEARAGIKAGMTADLVIKTASKNNVLIVPEDAIKEKEEKKIVRVLKEGVIEEREIEAGLVGSNDMVEVISGLKEGEKIIIREK